MLSQASRALLECLADGKFHSGQALAKTLNLSRTAVWQRLKSLRALGIEIQAVAGRGYRLARPLELLDLKQILAALELPPGCPTPVVEIHACLPSTNTYLLETAAKRPCASICLAEAQTQGKGRLGRAWISPFGYNVYLSVLWRFERGESLAGLSLAAGVATVCGLSELGFPELTLKWPNDLLWRGRKLGGILVEAISEPYGHCTAVLGLGVNLWLAPAAASAVDQPWVDGWSILGKALPSRNLIVAKCISRLLALLCSYPSVGLAPWLEDWRRLNCVLGQKIRVRQAEQEFEALALDVTEEGFLVVQRGHLRQVLAAGEVSLKLEHGG
jgi:BirA family biotin operon repressor/biotin-[acetyl-CoA-carboxylase] ligase